MELPRPEIIQPPQHNRFLGKLFKVLTPLVVVAGILVPGAHANTSGDYSPDVTTTVDAPAPEHTPLVVVNQNPCFPGSLPRTGQTILPSVAVTYDDGPDDNTIQIMDAFDNHGQHGKAFFFEIGDMVRQHPDIARLVLARGYEIGNHTMTHQYNPFIIASEIGPTQDLILSITGKAPEYFRSSGLTQGPIIQSTLFGFNMCNVFTRIDPHDWVTPRIPAQQICNNIEASVLPGDIILLHDGGTHAQTILATQTCLFPMLDRLGLKVVTLSQLFNGTLPGPAERSTVIPPGDRIANTYRLSVLLFPKVPS